MIKLSRSNVVVLAVYRTGPITAVFYDELSSMLELLVLYSCPIVITGDLNIHLDDPDDVNTVKLCNLLDSFGLIQSIQEPTHLLGRTLDVVITRRDLQAPVVRVGLPGRSSTTRSYSSTCNFHGHRSASLMSPLVPLRTSTRRLPATNSGRVFCALLRLMMGSLSTSCRVCTIRRGEL